MFHWTHLTSTFLQLSEINPLAHFSGSISSASPIIASVFTPPSGSISLSTGNQNSRNQCQKGVDPSHHLSSTDRPTNQKQTTGRKLWNLRHNQTNPPTHHFPRKPGDSPIRSSTAAGPQSSKCGGMAIILTFSTFIATGRYVPSSNPLSSVQWHFCQGKRNGARKTPNPKPKERKQSMLKFKSNYPMVWWPLLAATVGALWCVAILGAGRSADTEKSSLKIIECYRSRRCWRRKIPSVREQR